MTSLEKKGHHIDNAYIQKYIGLSGKIGNAMGIKILHDKDHASYDVGVDRRKDGWTTIYATPLNK